MTISANDISLVLSGGTTNINPNYSLGGDPSSAPVVSDALNNLFDDVTSTETSDGMIDYRCLYLFNDGQSTIYDVKLYIINTLDQYTQINLGFVSRNESQRITISGNVNGGTLTLSYEDRNFTTEFNVNYGDWATQLQSALRNLTISNDSVQKVFNEVTVLGQVGNGNSVIFDVRWSGLDAKRNLSKFQEVANSLTPAGEVTVNYTVPTEGAPINTIANGIGVESTPPGGVTFFTPTFNAPLIIPRLEPNEGFPFWIERIIPSGASAKQDDSVTIRISAQTL